MWWRERPALFPKARIASKARIARAAPRRRARASLLLAALASCPGWAAADEPRLKVSGGSSITTETRRSGEDYELRATLGDEVGRPIAGAELRVKLRAEGAATLRRCGGSAAEANELTLTTDATGRVCALTRGVQTGNVDFSFEDPRGYYERTSQRVALPDAAASSIELGFDPPLGTLSLDQPLQLIGVVARARSGASLDDSAELVLSVADGGKERELTRVALDGLGEVHRLSLVSAVLGQPGPVRLIAKLRTRSGQERASASAAVLTTATASLQLSGVDDGVEPGSAVQVGVVSALGPVPSGVVEVQSAGRSIAAARVQGGVASVALPSAPAGLLGKTVTLEYVGEGPGWLAGPARELRVRPARPGYGGAALWILAAILVATAVVLGWRRPPRPVPPALLAAPRVRASVEVLEPLGEREGYRGYVRDAHDGTPLSPAAVSFVLPGTSGRVLQQCLTTPDGSFRTESSFPAGTLIEVTAPFHATLTAPLPAPGVLELSLVSRRRALLDRLVRWAERHGKPWIRAGGDPTPATVATTAQGEQEPQVETWARSIEHLAFGASPPDAAREQAAGVLDDPKTSRERGID